MPELSIRLGISQESGLTFKVPLEKSGGGASVGGAAIATELQAQGISEYGKQIFKELGIKPPAHIILQTPTPYEDFQPDELELPYQLDLHTLPMNEQGNPEPYDEMINTYLDRQEIKNYYKSALDRGEKILDLSHFYVDASVRGAILEELEQEGYDVKKSILPVTFFHSSPAYTIRHESPEYYRHYNPTWERRMYEMAALRSSIVVFSTNEEREITARAYDGVNGLTYDSIMENSVVAPLPIDGHSSPEEASCKRKEARQELGIPENGILYMMISRLDTEKGYDALLKNFIDWIHEKLDQGEQMEDLPYLAVIGGVPMKNPHLVEVYNDVKNLVYMLPGQIKSHIHFEGKARNHSEVIDAADAYFGPSMTETLHLAPKEAGLHGIPAFLSDIAAHRETHPDDSAYLFGPHDQAQFFEAFEKARDPMIRACYGERNFQNSRRFTVEASTRTLLTQLIEKRRDFFTS